MIRRAINLALHYKSYPCTSGDDPEHWKGIYQPLWLSLHKRGWSQSDVKELNCLLVSPAQAGMILIDQYLALSVSCYPCTSGDDPGWLDGIVGIDELSLHKRGWSCFNSKFVQNKKVIPAQAGMILAHYIKLLIRLGYPCTSGDDPSTYLDYWCMY